MLVLNALIGKTTKITKITNLTKYKNEARCKRQTPNSDISDLSFLI